MGRGWVGRASPWVVLGSHGWSKMQRGWWGAGEGLVHWVSAATTSHPCSPEAQDPRFCLPGVRAHTQGRKGASSPSCPQVGDGRASLPLGVTQEL